MIITKKLYEKVLKALEKVEYFYDYEAYEDEDKKWIKDLINEWKGKWFVQNWKVENNECIFCKNKDLLPDYKISHTIQNLNPILYLYFDYNWVINEKEIPYNSKVILRVEKVSSFNWERLNEKIYVRKVGHKSIKKR